MNKEFEEKNDSEIQFSSSKRLQMATMESSTAAMIVVGNKLEKYYTDFIGMRPGLFGTAHLLYAFVNSINDPLLGYFIDHSSNKHGIIVAASELFIL